MAELLLEILSEEIPARMQRGMREQLAEKAKAMLTETGLYHTQISAYSTPRRIVLVVQGLSLTQEDSVIEKRGPRVDANEQALQGFLKSTGLNKEDLITRDTDKGSFYYGILQQKGRHTAEVLKEKLEAILPTLTWPKSMRWGDTELRWVRPITKLNCLFGGEVLPIAFGHIKAGRETLGHRFLSQGSFTIKEFAQYKEELQLRHVMLDQDARSAAILEQAHAICKAQGIALREDAGLLEEVVGLVEWPVVLEGTIEEDFMTLPSEVLVASIRTHQKYFCTTQPNGHLANRFLVVSNMKCADNGAAIIAGNERVLRARLSDARFFFTQDQKQPLEEFVPKLEQVVFHNKLGTVRDKVKRITKLARVIADHGVKANEEEVERAALLAKADLVSEMVKEFPELQGRMGYYYALAGREAAGVAEAIRDHYMPVGADDSCPKAPVSVAVAMADKIDTLVGLFAIGEAPTGSKDPFALRRAAIGVIRMILENQISLPLKDVFAASIKQFPSSVFKEAKKKNTEKPKTGSLIDRLLHSGSDELVQELMVFFEERIKALLKAQGVRHDLISAICDGGEEDDLLRMVKRVAALDQFVSSEAGANLLAAYTRASNIVAKEEKKDGKEIKGAPDNELLQQTEEKRLYTALEESEAAILTLLKKDAFEEALGILANLRTTIDAFFEHVTVNCENEELRRNRLRLLAQLRTLMHALANFAKIEG